MAPDGTQTADAPATSVAVASAQPASRAQVILLGVGLTLLALLLGDLFVSLWPANFVETTPSGEVQTIDLFGFGASFKTSAEVRLLLMVMVTGGLGSFVHTATSFGDFVGNERLTRSWIWWYLLKPFIGMILAVVFYLVMRGGFLSAGTQTGRINVYGVAALAGLAGMFSKQATDKLSEVFNTLFRTAPGGGDDQRKGELGNPVPVLAEVDPSSVEPGTKNVVVELRGAHFVPGSVVRVNGTSRETEFKDASRLTAKLLSDDVAKEGQLNITVFNPAPAGGNSTSLRIRVAGAGAANDDHVDGCDAAITLATPDEALPPARGGVGA